MNQNMPPPKIRDEEIDFIKLFQYFKYNWKWLVGGSVLGIAGAFGFLALTPIQYQATAIIKPATVGNIPANGINATNAEPMAQTLQRLKFTTFYTDDIVDTCQVHSASDLAKNVATNLLKGSDLLSISYYANSAALANTCVDAIFNKLMKSQLSIVAPLIKELDDQNMATKKQVEDIEKFLASLEKPLVKPTIAQNFSILLALKKEELTKLKKVYQEQKVQLSAPLTQSTKLLEPIYSPSEPVYPKKSIAILIGFVIGFFVGLLSLVAYRGWHHRKTCAPQ